jgi:hypothetical protein
VNIQYTSPYAQRVLLVLLFGLSVTGLTSLGSWFLQTGWESPPFYLVYLPYGIGIPYLLLGAPTVLVSAPASSVRLYSGGAIVLALGMAGAWSAAALLDPYATDGTTQMGLLIGWMGGGTTYEVLLLYLVARS